MNDAPLITLLGLGSAFSTATFGALRWPFAIASVGLLAVAFAFAYRWRPSRKNRVTAWLLAAAVAAAFYVALRTSA